MRQPVGHVWQVLLFIKTAEEFNKFVQLRTHNEFYRLKFVLQVVQLERLPQIRHVLSQGKQVLLLR